MGIQPPDKTIKGGLTLTIISPVKVSTPSEDFSEMLNISPGNGFTVAQSHSQLFQSLLSSTLRNLSHFITDEKLFQRAKNILENMFAIFENNGIVEAKIDHRNFLDDLSLPEIEISLFSKKISIVLYPELTDAPGFYLFRKSYLEEGKTVKIIDDVISAGSIDIRINEETLWLVKRH